ncbi:MAG: hypothetical protein K9M55_09805 [Candidatus Marinimicrobia bacterium]|nr:hypothetical protein [Candidatus Neomarinimicrobiota bacterium]
MMRPEKVSAQDIIDTLLQNSWEKPPDHLEYELKAIPTKIAMVQNRYLDRLTFILNAILVFWGVGLSMLFWSPLEKLIAHYSGLMMDYSSLSPQFLAQPLVGIIALACLIAGWVWLDLETHPRAPHFRVKS